MEGSRWESYGEEELVMLAQKGNLSAFDELVARYRPGAIVLASHIAPSREAAEDAVQDSFLAAYKALPHLEDPGRFPGWLGAIVRNRSRRILAGERNRHLPLDDLILCYSPSLSAQVEQREDSEALRQALLSLPGEFLPVVELYYIENWRVRQIAEFTALPATTVKWRLHAARKLLRTTLAECLEKPYEY